MAVVVTTGGADYFARLFLGLVAQQNLNVRLWVNYRQPAVNDLWSLYTECTWPGYSLIALESKQWTGGAQDGVADYVYPLVTFNFDPWSGTQQVVYGYGVLNDDETLLYVEAFAAPFPVPPEGGSIPLILTWVDEQCQD